MKTWICSLIVALTVASVSAQVVSQPTAKKAGEMANAQVNKGGDNRVIRLEGENSDSDLRPRQWDVIVYDPTRTNHGTAVRIKDGVAISLAPSVRMFDDASWGHFGRNFTGYDIGEVINLKRWKLDSTDAVAKVTAMPGVTAVQITAVKLTLSKLSDGDVAPVWQVKIKGRLRADPRRELWIGSVELSAETGEILKNNINIERLR